MILCDVGNSDVKFLQNHKFSSMNFEDFKAFESTAKVFYISVNEHLKEHLSNKTNFINLEPYFRLDTIYQGLGIDRVAACYTIDDGVVVDAGSAITVDVVSNSMHLGGFIMPGIASYRKVLAEISPRLKCEFNTQIRLDALPQRTMDALSFGVFGGIYMMIKSVSKNKKLYFTGGDGGFLANFFDKAIYDRQLVFRGMQKVIEQIKRRVK